jgi:3',5'-cyclic AMP phosphodiesterase CpdA
MSLENTLESPNSRVYLEYSFDDLPLHPGEDWTRFVCISDTHSRRFTLPPGDVLLHSGDLSSGGSVRALKETIDWLRELDYGHKV